MRNSDVLTNLIWHGNSKQMYEGVLNAVPILFRKGVNRSILDWIVKNDIKEVTEELVFLAVDEIAPHNIAHRIKKELEPLRTR